MAEVAAGALIAEQVVATGVEVAAAAAIAVPTQPLKVSISQLAKTEAPDDSPQSLGRSNHTLTTINNKVYIFGGEAPSGELCSSDVHAITLPDTKSASEVKHLAFQPFPLKDADTGDMYIYIPTQRAQHAACARGKYVIIHGGRDAHGKPIEEDNCLWLWDTESLQWTKLRGETQLGKAMSPRYGHRIFFDSSQDFLILHGGHTTPQLKQPPSATSAALSNPSLPTETETWLYDFKTRSWTSLPLSPSAPLAAAYTSTTLYTITADSSLSGCISYFPLLNSGTERAKPGALAWKTHTFPTNPLTPGPRPRAGGALIPLTTGHGRKYLLYMFGRSDEEFYSDMWTLQLPSHGFSAAAAKDKIRDKLPGMESEEFSWAEVELVPTEQMKADGKVHPGPRAEFGADAYFGGRAVVMWGGMNPKGEREGDGWVVGLAYGYADHDRFE